MAIEMFDSNHDYESESEEEEVCPSCDKIINADENPCGPGCPLYDEGLEDEEEVWCVLAVWGREMRTNKREFNYL